MKSNRYNFMLKANALLENRFLLDTKVLKEYDVNELENKRNQIISKLQNLRDKQKGLFSGVIKSKINVYISDLTSINIKEACQGDKLKSDLQTKLNSAKDGLKQKSMLDDPDNIIPTLETDIIFIENFCKSNVSRPTQSNTVVQQNTQRMRDENPQQITQPTNIGGNVNSLSGMRFMDALDTLSRGENYTKDDIINYVKSKVTVKTS